MYEECGCSLMATNGRGLFQCANAPVVTAHYKSFRPTLLRSVSTQLPSKMRQSFVYRPWAKPLTDYLSHTLFALSSALKASELYTNSLLHESPSVLILPKDTESDAEGVAAETLPLQFIHLYYNLIILTSLLGIVTSWLGKYSGSISRGNGSRDSAMASLGYLSGSRNEDHAHGVRFSAIS